jgi:hypothetical protein
MDRREGRGPEIGDVDPAHDGDVRLAESVYDIAERDTRQDSPLQGCVPRPTSASREGRP